MIQTQQCTVDPAQQDALLALPALLSARVNPEFFCPQRPRVYLCIMELCRRLGLARPGLELVWTKSFPRTRACTKDFEELHMLRSRLDTFPQVSSLVEALLGGAGEVCRLIGEEQGASPTAEQTTVLSFLARFFGQVQLGAQVGGEERVEVLRTRAEQALGSPLPRHSSEELRAFVREWGSPSETPPKLDLPGDFNPIGMFIEWLPLEGIAFGLPSLEHERVRFLRLLASSISLSKHEKRRMVVTMPDLREAQVTELLSIFEEEQQKFHTLAPNHFNQLWRLAFQHAHQWLELQAEFARTTD